MADVADVGDVRVTAADMAVARDEVARGIRGAVTGLVSIIALTGFVGGLGAAVLPGAPSTLVVAFMAMAVAIAVGTPMIVAVSEVTKRRGLKIAIEAAVHTRLLQRDADRRQFETQLGRAFEMADDELAAYETVRRAMASIAPTNPSELLLADHSHAHLERTVVAVPDGAQAPGCDVDSPHRCIAVRRAQTQRFADSDAIDACPYLRGRSTGACSAVCVPVSITGRSVGVLHATGVQDTLLGDDTVEALQTLADQAGHHLGMLRVLAETESQAMTDGLTGLINRRTFENRMSLTLARGTQGALLLADLDHFKRLNDTYGHEAGDRALRVFAHVMRDQVGTDGIVCRYGGEEFVIALPDRETFEAIELADRIRQALAEVGGRGETPVFTASFGIAHSADADDLEDLVKRADRALFAAKDGGRDRVCLDGYETALTRNLTALA